jgi:hypothetical protein
MADELNKHSFAREGEPSQKTEQGLETPILKPLIKLAFHER